MQLYSQGKVTAIFSHFVLNSKFKFFLQRVGKVPHSPPQYQQSSYHSKQSPSPLYHLEHSSPFSPQPSREPRYTSADRKDQEKEKGGPKRTERGERSSCMAMITEKGQVGLYLSARIWIFGTTFYYFFIFVLDPAWFKSLLNSPVLPVRVQQQKGKVLDKEL